MMIPLPVAWQGLLTHASKLCYLERGSSKVLRVSVLSDAEVLTAKTHLANKATGSQNHRLEELL